MTVPVAAAAAGKGHKPRAGSRYGVFHADVAQCPLGPGGGAILFYSLPCDRFRIERERHTVAHANTALFPALTRHLQHFPFGILFKLLYASSYPKLFNHL